MTQDLTMAEALAQAIHTLELKASCSHCGQECAELKRCSVCKHASYYSKPEIQNPFLSPYDVNLECKTT